MADRGKRKRSLLSDEAQASSQSPVPPSSPPFIASEEDDEEEEIPLPQPERRRSNVMRKRRSDRVTLRGTVAGIIGGGADAILSSDKGHDPNIQNKMLTNMSVVENWAREVTVNTVRERISSPPDVGSLLTFMQAPIHDNRKCEVKELKNPTRQFSSYVVRIVNTGSSSSFSKEGVTLPFPTDYYTKTDVQKFTEPLCRLLERWPHDVTNNMSASVKRAMVAAISEAICPEVPRILGSIRYYEPKDTYITEITVIDPQSGTQYKHKEFIQPKDMVVVEDLPQEPFVNCIFGIVRENKERFQCPNCPRDFGSSAGLKYHLTKCESAQQNEGDGAASTTEPSTKRKKRAKPQKFEEPAERPPIPAYASVVPANISDEVLRQKHLAAEWLCKFLTVKLSNKVVASLNVARLCEFYGKQFANWKKPYRGIYGGKPLCTLQAMKRSRQTRICRSAALQKDLSFSSLVLRAVYHGNVVTSICAALQDYL